MNAGKDLSLVLFILIILFFSWLATGGPERSANDRLSSTSTISSDNSIADSSNQTEEPEMTREDIDYEIRKTQREIDQLKEEIDLAEEFGDPSPFRGLVEFETDTSGAKNTDAKSEYVIIKASLDNSSNVTISGWELYSPVSGRKVSIGGASRLPYSGQVNSEPAISLPPENKLIVSTGRSPIGSSFRTNLCTGFFKQFQEFDPSLKSECPYPEDELSFADDIQYYDEACVNFIESMPRCEMLLSSIPTQFNSSCHNFITENINYSGCVKNHKNEIDFFKKEWRIYLEHNNEIWRESREVIRLLDQNGKTVDVLSY